MYRDDFVNNAYEFIGTKEKSGGHQTIVDIYNTINPLPRGYKVTTLDPWCSIFVSAMLAMSGLAYSLPVECSCTKMLTMYETNPKFGTVVTEKTDPTMTMISHGDLIFYGPKASPVGESSHVGIVCDVTNTRIRTIEGNWRNSVYLRRREYDDKVWDGVRAYVKIKFPDEVWQGELAAAKDWAVTEELIKGDENGINWKEPITLERLAVILHRLCTT
jgi:hypothetical protein